MVWSWRVYSVQSNDPSFHSWSKPRIRITRNKERLKIDDDGEDISGSSGIGRRRTISMSKTRKITANRKNRRENGIRAEFLGSNPHSNGDSFSRSWLDRAARTQAIVGTRRAIVAAVTKEKYVRCMVCM